MADFYDELAPVYHFFFEDWEASIRWQRQRLSAILRREWPGRLCELLVEAGFCNVKRLDDIFYQPVLAGKKPA